MKLLLITLLVITSPLPAMYRVVSRPAVLSAKYKFMVPLRSCSKSCLPGPLQKLKKEAALNEYKYEKFQELALFWKKAMNNCAEKGCAYKCKEEFNNCVSHYNHYQEEADSTFSQGLCLNKQVKKLEEYMSIGKK